MKVVILAISWKKFRGFGRAHAVRDVVCAFSCANISWFASRPRKPRKYYPSKNTRYTVFRNSLNEVYESFFCIALPCFILSCTYMYIYVCTCCYDCYACKGTGFVADLTIDVLH